MSTTGILPRLLLVAVVSVTISEASLFGDANGASITDEVEKLDLLRAIAVPFADPSTQFFVTGFDGFPAFGFNPGASIKHPYRLILPERFFRTFSILVAMKPDTDDPMFVFAVTNPLENIIQLGVGVAPANPGFTNISLYYTDGERHMTSQTVAAFLVPEFVGTWARFAFSVSEEEVQLWYNCERYSSVMVKRVPQQLVFDSASTLFIGQAGGIFKGEFEGALQELQIFNEPGIAKVQCDESFTMYDDPLLVGGDEPTGPPTEPIISVSAATITTTTAAPSPMATQSNAHPSLHSPTQSSSERPVERICDNTYNVMREVLQHLRAVSSTHDISDEYDFGNVVANDLRQMNEENKIYAQKLIHDVLFLGKLGNLSSSTKVVE